MPVLQLNPKKTALVLIDLQNAIVGVNTAPYAAVQVVANSKKLAGAFRAAGAPVIYVNVDFNGFLKPPAVESTARQGTGLGFAFVLVEDACAGLDPEEHRFAFEKIFPRLARIRATDEVIAALV